QFPLAKPSRKPTQSPRGLSLLRSPRARGLGAFIAAALILAFTSFSIRSRAQTNAVTMAPGFDFNLFADSTNVPDFAGGNDAAFAGAVSMAFDARGRLFVGTYPGKILI